MGPAGGHLHVFAARSVLLIIMGSENVDIDIAVDGASDAVRLCPDWLFFDRLCPDRLG